MDYRIMEIGRLLVMGFVVMALFLVACRTEVKRVEVFIDPGRDFFNQQLATVTAAGDPEMCNDLLESDTHRLMCKNRAYNRLAVMNTKPELCDSIESEEKLLSTCKDVVFTQKARNEGKRLWCSYTNSMAARNHCGDLVSFDQALDRRSHDLCESIGDTTLRGQCHDQIPGTFRKTVRGAGPV